MEPPIRDAGFATFIKCSSCASEIELSAIAEHICRQDGPALLPQPYYDRVPLPENHIQYQQQAPRAVSPLRAQRPTLPKLDSAMTGRHGLRPSEAASIARDLGLPSPSSAGNSSSRSPRRSKSRSRKAIAPRSPSPEIPISQDCAFPPFPMKPKREYGEKEQKTHHLQSTSRSITSTNIYNHSSNLSNASSVYSNTSGPGKTRISNASSSQRSRQGTVDDSMSLPSTAPSSPRQSIKSPISREQTNDQMIPLPALMSSDSYTYSEPGSSSSTMPPTPSWPPETREPSPRILQSSGSDIGWTPTESTIPEENHSEMDSQVHKDIPKEETVTFDRMLTPNQLKPNLDMFDNPPREPLYKTRRPAPLLTTEPQTQIDPMMPLSARSPSQSSQSGGGLARTLSNFFGRKRSQTSASRTMPLPSSDSVRMRALAPDPPERPTRGDSLWDDVTPADETATVSRLSTTDDHTSLQARDQLPLDHAVGVSDNIYDTQGHSNQLSTENTTFDFGLNNSNEDNDSHHSLPNQDHHSSEDDRQEQSMSIPELTYSKSQDEQDLRRASIDSASSYGSIGFSTNRTASSRSDAPIPDDTDSETTATPLQPDQQPIQHFEFDLPAKPRIEILTPESPVDPLYSAGKLSPVPESRTMEWTHSSEQEKSPPNSLAAIAHDLHNRAVSKSSRPETPSGIKGRCRGCSDLILTGQKSLASADGRLTGRYHKECFVCRTCREPFATADFYVHDDQPYCAHHYHVLNGTLCTGCGKGIEGQYLQTFDQSGSTSKKFHPKCLQCATCKIQLNDDYFEFHGRVYCERDAFRAANGPVRNPYDTVPSRPSPLVREYINSEEPRFKGRFPERRTTRLIMT